MDKTKKIISRAINNLLIVSQSIRMTFSNYFSMMKLNLAYNKMKKYCKKI